jgi:OmcA/MtrC family decaheme c-type cytochrome
LRNADNVTLALNAPSRTFDLGANAFVNNYYQGTTAVVKEAGGCNNCHEALGTTFHSGDRGGNVVVCRLCHTPANGGSHLEMQSRSIDSYVHAIHSFQAFDVGDVDFTDPVEATMYDLHIEHTYPNFTITNCKSCHNAGTFNVPDQAKSLPGVLSATDNTSAVGWERNIGVVDSYVTGPATRACGACHRAKAIKEDSAVELASFYSHTKTNGYLVECTSSTRASVLESVTNAIMANFYDGIVLPTP